MAILTVLQARLHELLTMRSVQHQLLHLLSEQEVADLHVHEVMASVRVRDLQVHAVFAPAPEP